MSPASCLVALLAALGPGRTGVASESAAGVRLLDPGSLSVEEVARNSVEWLRPPRTDAQDFFAQDFLRTGVSSRPHRPLDSRLGGPGAVDSYRGEFVASPQIPAGHFELDSTPTGLSFTLEDARPGTAQVPAAQAAEFTPSRYPYPGRPTGHFDLTYNSTALNFTLTEAGTTPAPLSTQTTAVPSQAPPEVATNLPSSTSQGHSSPSSASSTTPHSKPQSTATESTAASSPGHATEEE